MKAGTHRRWGGIGAGQDENDKSEKKTKTKEKNTEGDVISLDTHIFFYSEVDDNPAKDLHRELLEAAEKIKARRLKTGMTGGQITLHINSYGGSLLAGFALYDVIRTCDVPVVGVVEGACASAATFILLGCSRRQMHQNSVILIHQLSSWIWGKYEELVDEKQNLDRFMSMITNIYRERSKLPVKKIREVLKHDLWWTAEEALDCGLIDEIVD
jgi:ATP-dependent protease ClpP protease subunit